MLRPRGIALDNAPAYQRLLIADTEAWQRAFATSHCFFEYVNGSSEAGLNDMSADQLSMARNIPSSKRFEEYCNWDGEPIASFFSVRCLVQYENGGDVLHDQ